MKTQILHHLSRYALSPSCKDVIFLDKKGHCHIESFYLVSDSPIRELVLDVAAKEIDIDKIQNLAGFMHGGISLASLIEYKLKVLTQLPLYAFDNDLQEIPIKFNKTGNNYAIIIGYTSTKEQIIDAVMKIEKQGGKVVKVLSMIDEEMGAKKAVEEKGIEFVSILTLSEVKNEVRTQIQQVKERISSVETLLK